MSRLDSFIRRVSAQRDVLDHVCGLIDGLPGPVLELGLGNGRTFDHLRERLSGHRIIAFDRALGAHKSSVPPEDDLVLGEIRETAARFTGIGAALVHADIETNYAEVDAETMRWLPPLAAGLLQPGGVVASGLPLRHSALQHLDPPADVPAGRYFLYRRTV
ncbi:class I SAM-dependent methyltransferase [Labrys sp. KB_33_2]|uniref:class I SAM-dependent methyltransferase n=1 Tax=Labrys sp. KB_33_2 TaxID=3237479 RepID=UPI003F907171